MVKKKVTKTKKKASVPMPPFDYEQPFIPGLVPEYVRCRICNISLPHLNFEWPAVPTDVTIGVVKGAISARHGGTVPGLVLWRGSVAPNNSLAEVDDVTSLRQLGVRGVTTGAPGTLPAVTLHYDFYPVRHDDAIASVEGWGYARGPATTRVDLKTLTRTQHAQPPFPYTPTP